MKAWVLHNINDIQFNTVEVPIIRPDEVLIRVSAAGICGSDIPRVFRDGAHNMPLIPGHEFSGTVEETGNAVNPDWKGKRVGIYPLIPCGCCRPCIEGHMELCRNYDYLGSRRNGGFAEYVAVPAQNIIELPDSISNEAAAMLEPMAVAVHAMRIGLGSGDSRLKEELGVAICGLGTIGLLLSMFLLDVGYKNLYVIGNKDSQRDLANKIGVSTDNFCDSRVDDPKEWLQNRSREISLYFECTGRIDALNYGLFGVSPLGRIVTVGNPFQDMDIPRDAYWKILRNQLSIYGTWNSTFTGRRELTYESTTDMDDWQYAIDRVMNKAVHPAELITHKFELESLNEGLELMRDKKEEYCKVMIDCRR